MYYRNCPQCGKELSHTTKKNRNSAKKKQRHCYNCARLLFYQTPAGEEAKKKLSEYNRIHNQGVGNPFYGHTHSKDSLERMSNAQKNKDNSVYRTKEFKEKMSKITAGEKNPMYNRKVYDIWLEKYGETEAKARLSQWSKKQSANTKGSKNPMFGKPTPNGAGNGWGGWYKEWYFRSLRELSYMINVIELNQYQWERGEKLSIPYTNYDGAERTYRPDFLLNGSIIIEVKPKKLMETPANRLKKEAAISFCSQNGYEYRMVDVKIIEFAELKNLCAKQIITLSDPSRLEEYETRRNKRN